MNLVTPTAGGLVCLTGQRNRKKLKHTQVTVMTSDGVELAAHVYGVSSARHTVVLLHGLCVSSDVWSRQVAYLLGRYGANVRVITYDHRGHGKSSAAPAHTYCVDQLASDLADVLAALHVRGALTLVGHSMGGMTALAYLGRPRADRPVDAQGLVLAATAAGKLSQRGLGRLLATPGIGVLLRAVNRVPKLARQALAAPLCATLGRIWPTQRPMLTTMAEVAGTASLPAAGFLPRLRDYDQYENLDRIDAKTVVISGGADPVTPASHSREIAGTIPDSAHVHLPQAGHMLPHEDPDAINDAISHVMFSARAERLAA
ncbi:alpha/beta fold hydrolase [Mycobacterium spongiae]|nr:alpha/beta hydrolase [Mycobacterium spongiae]